MKRVPLKSVAKIARNIISPKDISPNCIYVGLEHISGEGEFLATPLSGEAQLKSTKFRFGPNHVLYGKLRPYLRKIARPTFYGVCSTDILPLETGPDLDRDYLFHFLRTPAMVRLATQRCAGVNLPRLSPRLLEQFEVPLPTLSEQKHIAAILDKADDIRRKREKAINLNDSLLRSIFLEMFGNPVSNPKEWPQGTIRDLVTEVKYGTSKKAGAAGQYEILRMNNITYSGQIDLTDLKYIDLESDEISKYLVRKGDLLFNRTNSKELVGKCAIYPFDKERAIAGYLIRVRTNNRANSEYIAGYLNSKHGKSTLQHMCKSIIGMANINAQELQDIKIHIPPRELQDRYARIVEKIRKTVDTQKQALSKSNTLFKALSTRLFTGQSKSSSRTAELQEAHDALQL